MRYLKSHIAVIFPIVVILLSLQFSFTLERIVKNYEVKLIEDYNIIIVSIKNLDEKELKKDISDFKSLQLMSTRGVLEKLKGDISSKNLSLLQIALPKFYSLKLNSFPTSSKIKNIKKTLNNYPSVTKVEIFSKTYDKIYHIFVIAKITSYVFSMFVLLISFFLMLKQMKIWVYEHKERMDIMKLFGAPFLMKSAFLYKLVIIDSFISTFIVAIAYYFLPKISYMQTLTHQIGIVIPQISLLSDGILLLATALIVGICSVSIVMIKIVKG